MKNLSFVFILCCLCLVGMSFKPTAVPAPPVVHGVTYVLPADASVAQAAVLARSQVAVWAVPPGAELTIVTRLTEAGERVRLVDGAAYKTEDLRAAGFFRAANFPPDCRGCYCTQISGCWCLFLGASCGVIPGCGDGCGGG